MFIIRSINYDIIGGKQLIKEIKWSFRIIKWALLESNY